MFNVTKILKIAVVGASFVCLVSGAVYAQEVGKGKIPESQLEKTYNQLGWGAKIWDVDEAIASKKSKEKVLWVDTRPTSFFSKGPVRDAVSLIYNKKGKEENILTADSLAGSIKAAGMEKDEAKVIFFCQGPKCHRSYNASFTAVTEWGYPAGNIVWFREGYPYLFKAIKEDAKLKRKAKKYISDGGLTQL